MTNPSTESRRGATIPLKGLVIVTAVAVAAWWSARVAGGRALDATLASWAGAPLPAVDGPIRGELADLGAQVFEKKCAACHALRGEPKLAPNLEGVTLRRDYPWIQAMVMRPDSMLVDDPVARALRLGYAMDMKVPGGMTPERTLAVLEFLRRVDRDAFGG